MSSFKDWQYYTKLLTPQKARLTPKESALANLYNAKALLLNNQIEAAKSVIRFATRDIKDIKL